MSLSIGQILHERYRIDKLLGQGGMGAVYCASDLTFNASVAIKENQFITPESQKQFSREAELLYHLRHPNLPRVIDYFVIPGQGQYLVMDYIEGEDLKEKLDRQGQVPQEQACAWIRQVLDALAYLHARQVIHRDVKPANIKITPDGRVVLVDFGLAKAGDLLQETTIGARGVTPGFAPLEQYGQSRTDVRSDIYSVGATLYNLLTGQVPPEAPKLATGEVYLVRPREIDPQISPQVEKALLRAMQTRPTDRFQSVQEFATTLAGSPLTRLASVQQSGAAPSARMRRVPARWFGIAVAAIVGLGMILSVWGLLANRGGFTSAPTQSALVELTTAPVVQAVPTASPTPSLTLPVPVETATAEPSPSPPRRTATPSRQEGSPTPVVLSPTSSRTPTNTLTPTPTLTLSPSTTPSSSPIPELWGKIAFATTRYGYSEICRVQADGSNLLRLTSNEVYDWHPNWSPDGKRLVFVTNRDGSGTDEIYTMSANGSNPVRLTQNQAKDDTPSWHPNGTRIFFSSQRDGNWEIYSMGVNGSDVRRLTNHSALDQYPTVAPDGRQVGFVSERDGNREIYIANIDGSEVRRLTRREEEDWAPAWSPNGHWIAFSSKVDASEWALFLVRPDGSDLTRLTSAGGEFPAWSPDGTKIVFLAARGDSAALYIINADGSNEKQITSTATLDWSPTWSQ